ncbi:MAG: toprim domain-containing protein [Candidatus Aminicenantes bacterium]|nr:toprim domain-containing protein [Candidatus Aminicenantes bacterium]NIQ65520.1 toprim domain-containing protein [Candidatus Aminicenantes bacterium]NIT21520.1 toprim domain-containing protein [Candidatus Aminicenantes bacterium]
MVWVANSEIERIKQEVLIRQLVEYYGVTLKKKGNDLVGLCPMHEDKKPSLVITPDKNLWHCMGACQEGGSVIDWVMKIEGVSFRHAVEILKERHFPGGDGNGRDKEGKPIKIALPSKPVKQSTVRKVSSTFPGSAQDQELLNKVVNFYHETLKDSPEGIEYLQKRGLKNSEIIDRFKLGLSNRTLCYRLPEKNRKAGADIRRKLQQLGILRDSGHEHFAGSLVIPVYDETGNVVEIYGRKLRNYLREGTTYHLYLPGPHRGVWNFSCLAAAKCKEIILCEALIDALTFWCYGFRNVTSSYGINGFTKEHLEAFKRFGIRRVLVAYDRDEAGDKAAETLAKKLTAEGIECFRIKFPMGMDANECCLKFKNVEKALKQLIQNALGKERITKVTTPPAATASYEAVENEKEKLTHAPQNNIDIEISNIPVQKKPEGVLITLENRQWRIRGLEKNMSYEILRVNVRVSKEEHFYLDTMDLYSARQRVAFIKQAAEELEDDEEAIKKDLCKVLLKLEELQDEQIKQTLAPKKKEMVMSEKEKQEALALLKAPDLLERIVRDFEKCGVVGEQTNKLVGYLAAVSRKLESPLAILIQSSSAAGKTWLMEAVLSFMPEEERIKYSAMTGQSLFYMGETNIKHKILAIVEEEGAERTRYALKLLQSEGELSIASTGKDPITGHLTTKEYRVEGPVMIFSTTTNIDIDEELQNRCIILTVDESREQTRAIHQMQRERRTFEGLRLKKEKDNILELHRNAQRLLRPLFIINPYARRLTFLDDKTRTRRDHEKYLSLIDSIAFLHQYQRQIKSTGCGDNGRPDENIIVTLEDIRIANSLANEVLGRSLDELPPQTRNLLMIIDEMVEKECKGLEIERSEYRFSRRQVREYCGWGNTRVKMHFKRLEELEYLIVHRGKRGLTFEYELLYDGNGKDGSLFLMGLIDVDQLRSDQKQANNYKYDENKSGLKGQIYEYDKNKSGVLSKKSAPSRAQVAPKSGGGRGVLKPLVNKVLPFFLEKEPEKGI